MRAALLLLICTLALSSQMTYAQDLPDVLINKKSVPTTKEGHLNAFFSKCSTYTHPVYDQSYQNYLCGCMTARMQDDFTEQEARNLLKPTQRGREATDRMWMRHYAHCMPETTQALIKESCLKTLGKQTQIKKVKSVCDCKANTVHRMISNTILDRIEWTLSSTSMQKNADTSTYNDIMADYFEKYGFNDDNTDALRRCIYREEYGWQRGR